MKTNFINFIVIVLLLVITVAACNTDRKVTNVTLAVDETATCTVMVTLSLHPAEPELIFVEGGTLRLGCNEGDCSEWELPGRLVTLNDFKIAKHQVTQKQWELIMGTNPSYFRGDDLPVERVSWYDVQEFIERLNEITGKNYRLATEREWEYAARGGTRSEKFGYSGSNDINEVAWYGSNSGNRTHPVGRKEPNELGIYDMTGNVKEWCSDLYYAEELQKTARVTRGGSWSTNTQFSLVSYRTPTDPEYRFDFLGVRLAHP